MCRVIKMSDVMGAARDASYSGSFGWVENWDGASSAQLDEMLEGAGLPTAIEVPLEAKGRQDATAAPIVPSKGRKQPQYAPLDESPSVRLVAPPKPRRILVGNMR